MITQKQATNEVIVELFKQSKLYPNTRIFIKNVLGFDFGWYFEYGVSGEMLAGGTDHGIFVHKNGHKYPLHYVGFPWDTGLNYNKQVDQPTVYERNGVLHPNKYAIRYFVKQVKEINSTAGVSFKEKNGYDFDGAADFLKRRICMPLDIAKKSVSFDSGINIDPTNPNNYNVEIHDKFQKTWLSITNEELLDENWASYFNTKEEKTDPSDFLNRPVC